MRLLIENYIKTILDEENIEYEVIKYCSGEELLEANLKDVDILLLDIKMDNINGMDVARKIRQSGNKMEIIFITSLIDYVQDGYEVKAYRYLLKPINFEVRYSLEKIEKDLNLDQFVRCHKSFIVNLNYVENIKSNIAILENGEEIPVSRYRYKDVKTKFLKFLGDSIC